MPTPIPRRAFIRGIGTAGVTVAVAGAAGTFLTACGSDASPSASGATTGAGPATVAYQLGWLMDEQFSGEYLAAENGYWTDEDLTVDLIAGGPNVVSVAVVETGQADITIAQPDGVARAIDNGGDFRIIGAKYQKAPYAITSLASSPIETPEDMVGKRIGVTANNQPIWETFLRLNDLDPSSITVVPVQFDPTPLAAGEVDGWLSFITDEPVSLSVQGVDTTSFLFYDFGYEMIAGCYIVTGQTFDDPARLDAVTRFMAGDILGWQDAIADPEAAADLAVNSYSVELGLDPTKALRTVEATNDLITARGAGTDRGIFTLDDQGIDGSIATVEASGLSLDRDVFAPQVLDDLYDGRVSL